MSEPNLPYNHPDRIAARERAAVEQEAFVERVTVQALRAAATVGVGLYGISHIVRGWHFHIGHKMDTAGLVASVLLTLGGIWLWIRREENAEL